MQQQQGFCSSELEYVEIDNTSKFNALKVTPYIPKKHTNTLKLASLTANSQLYINSRLKQHLKTTFKRSHSNIVYQHQNPIAFYPSQLTFNSEYQNANLQYVISQDHAHYDLYIQPDSNTTAHFQWFRFKVKNKDRINVTFTIHNFRKKNMLYRHGLRPYYKSLKARHINYQQITTQCTYKQDQISQDDEEEEGNYCLQFSFKFQYANDQVQFCSQPPYGLDRYHKIFNSTPFSRITISKTVMNRNIDAFLVNQNRLSKAVVVVFARQHPGQSVGSWLMQGLVNKLIDIPADDIQWILVPMLNPDGVSLGNNRTGMLGFDFNRHWYIDKDAQRSHLFPELIGIIRYFKQKQKDYHKKIKIFIDFHGHSSQSDVFSYGPPHCRQSQFYELSRLFPYIISTKNKDFNYKKCSFIINHSKKHCARAIFFDRLGYNLSYTIQSSFGIYKNRRINEVDVMKVGEAVCQSIHEIVQMALNRKQGPVKYKINDIFKQINQSEHEIEPQIDDDSDSDQDDDNPFKKNFQKQITKLLNPSQQGAFPSKEVNLLVSKSAMPNRKRITQKQSLTDHTSNTKMRQTKPSIVKFRFKTEKSSSLTRQRLKREESLVLPRLEHQRYETQPPSVLDFSFNNLSLDQIKSKLNFIRNSKLGKKILIHQRH